MRLVSLELHGFKSFADHQKLVFPEGMTGVVGPNGCGKSNISDALAWVLGEQRASLLRGTEMADVVFAGTSQRKPMGMAEVKLALEMPDAALPGAMKEITISRRVHLDSGSEYRINGRECRLKDIQDLLLDTGMGTRAYSFIQQGQIDLILSSKPKDRRSLIEEAAGITRYKLRRTEAERRLEETRGNLLRLDDILFELSKQRESLQRQAARTRRAQELEADIKRTQRILLSGKLSEFEFTKEQIAGQLDALERQIATLTAQASEKASEVEHLRHDLDDKNGAQEARHRAMLGVDQRLGLAEQDRGFQMTWIQEARDTQTRLEGRIEELGARSGDAAVELSRLQDALTASESMLAAREKDLAGTEENTAIAAGISREADAQLRELRVKRAAAEKASLEAQRQRHLLHQKIAQLEGRLDALNHEEALRAPRLGELTNEEALAGREREAAENRLEQVEEAISIQSRLLEEATKAFQLCASQLREAEGDLDGEERAMRHLADLLQRSLADEEGRKGLAWLREQGEDAVALADVLGADDEVRSDVERLLGAWVQSVAVGGRALAKLAEAPGHLFLWPSCEVGVEVETPSGCAPILPHLKWRAGALRPLEALLARSFKCGDDAIAGLAVACPACAFVSPGLVRLPFGPIQLGVKAPEASPLKLHAEYEASKKKREALLERVEHLETERKTLQMRFQEAQERSREMEEDLTLARRSLEALKGRQASCQAQIREIKEAQERADAHWDELEREIAEEQQRLRVLELVPEEKEEAGLTEAIQHAEARHMDTQAELERCRGLLMEAGRARDAALAERDGLQRQVLQFQRGSYDLEAEKQRLHEELQETIDRQRQAGERIQRLEAETRDLLDERQRITSAHAEALPELERIQEALRVHERMRREIQQALENARELHQEALITGAQVQGAMDALAKEIELGLSLEVRDFIASITEEEREAWSQGELVHQTRFSELQARRVDLGSVNPMALQELQEAEERLGFMHQQRADVMEAIGNLESTIKEINATSEERFKEAFAFINIRFQEVFREAFGGGQAQLALENPEDLLECGIEITAQPPGKTAKSLTLLSGGEKALTAISLLFAIFHYKPSPFCVLDEVDAPLDEANVTRFAAMVQRMKTGTQFVVITHQKPTMIAADSLYGVTMEEQGISKLVSVQLREAEQML